MTDKILPPALYLIPSTMSDAPVREVLPPANLDVVRGIRHFVVENVRTARRFIKRCDPSINIDELTFTTLNTRTPREEIASMLAPLRQGHPVGVISEAGCPAVADPGSDLVAAAHIEGFAVKPLVGPSSILMALMGSGFNGQSFAFNGYLPIQKPERTAKFRQLENLIVHHHQTQIFIETPYRNNALVADLIASLPGHLRLCIAIDITGPGEKILTHTLAQWAKIKPNLDKIPTIFLLYK